MLILTLRTDKPESELGLYNDKQQLAYEVWVAHRQLAETIHQKLNDILQQAGKQLSDIEGIVAFRGPGSFTGLRIGLSVVNALGYSLGIPVTTANGEWIEQGITRLVAGQAEPLALPEYGSEAFVTMPKK